MNDLISRQAAIDICANAIDLWHGQLGEGALVAVRNKISGLPSAQPEIKIMEDGTLSITVDMDITNVGRILLNQKGTNNGALYYKE